jgi:lambda repressor-like predicted transcriptional regulator
MAFNESAFRAAQHAAGFRSMRELSAATGISHSMLALVARGYQGNDKTRAKIAAAMNVDPSAIWPMVEVG